MPENLENEVTDPMVIRYAFRSNSPTSSTGPCSPRALSQRNGKAARSRLLKISEDARLVGPGHHRADIHEVQRGRVAMDWSDLAAVSSWSQFVKPTVVAGGAGPLHLKRGYRHTWHRFEARVRTTKYVTSVVANIGHKQSGGFREERRAQRSSSPRTRKKRIVHAQARDSF